MRPTAAAASYNIYMEGEWLIINEAGSFPRSMADEWHTCDTPHKNMGGGSPALPYSNALDLEQSI